MVWCLEASPMMVPQLGSLSVSLKEGRLDPVTKPFKALACAKFQAPSAGLRPSASAARLGSEL